ncbi:MAG: helix-turn-helix transcriptional regulator [Saccharopolyspora sp.]|uniref:helix-turn-helix domain-containing protein n=1 Tax=Saccharopolyspora TaxID=1835 RepID=UPI00190D30EE|nr:MULTISPECIES: helix-turn-helix transcriptional regulator [unclassified Saccharopolyspora]MBK0868200.1 helix-turn-helix transcriptional regulator [Saccharopolyspora sp. HNM0986]MBQ6641408.1 helix-turn-helix transcriptional regulator [Saccharopolyspora sp.]
MTVNTRTPKARAVGSALRKARLDNGISLRGLATQLGKDPSQLSRWETGERAPKPTDVAQILAHLGVTGSEYDEIVEVSGGTHEPRWLAVTLPEQRQQLAATLEVERGATGITEVSPLLVPGLLQTREYVHAIMSAGGVDADEVATRSAIRLGRRETIFGQEPATFTGVIGEAALRQVIGGPKVMLDQLKHLLESGERSNVEIQVVPFSTGWHPALEGLFALYETEQGPVVHLENRRSGLFLHEPADVQTYQQAVARVRAVALSPDDSSAFVHRLINEMEGAR